MVSTGSLLFQTAQRAVAQIVTLVTRNPGILMEVALLFPHGMVLSYRTVGVVL